MLFNEFGNKKNPAILLLHAMIQDWRGLWKMLKPLEEKYRVIVPAMDGMYENSPDFTNFPDQCRQMEIFIKENYDGKLRGVYGISQGATVLSELIARNNVKIDVAVLDGGYVAHQGKIAAYFTTKMFRSVIKNGGKPPKLMNIFFKFAGMDKEKDMKMLDSLFWNVSQESLKRNMYENYTYRANPNLENSDTMVHLWCGSKEPYVIKSHNMFKKYLQNYNEEIFENLGHAHFLLYHTDEICEKLGDIFLKSDA